MYNKVINLEKFLNILIGKNTCIFKKRHQLLEKLCFIKFLNTNYYKATHIGKGNNLALGLGQNARFGYQT